ncbi:HalOD1 output domain-containing protein [Natrarchaeobius chitinivorans]|uniref:Halobacterial output domain-containing protein n=1 Tax=Natrarchaeobius chitinivorans TaxID=1679083 RepID=A0A3N6LRA4_NATCH|nr:HalOD1 output domain-containing protein [Natrarchaeobius chitinivorans]RQG92233.1 hypothetical protein EA473_17120 [Natrarchaeobius chitinivorans]
MTKRRTCESDRGAYGRRVQYERGEDEPPSIAVATALAQYRGEDVLGSSTHLYEYVDPEALDSLFSGTNDGRERTVRRIEFDVEGATVVVEPSRVEVSSSD